MKCRLLLCFTILGFHLVVSYPNIQTQRHKDGSQSNLEVLKPDQSEKYVDKQKEGNYNKGSEVISHDQVSRLKGKFDHHRDKSAPLSYRDNDNKQGKHQHDQDLHAKNRPKLGFNSEDQKLSDAESSEVKDLEHAPYASEYQPRHHEVNDYKDYSNESQSSEESNNGPVNSQVRPSYESSENTSKRHKEYTNDPSPNYNKKSYQDVGNIDHINDNEDDIGSQSLETQSDSSEIDKISNTNKHFKREYVKPSSTSKPVHKKIKEVQKSTLPPSLDNVDSFENNKAPGLSKKELNDITNYTKTVKYATTIKPAVPIDKDNKGTYVPQYSKADSNVSPVVKNKYKSTTEVPNETTAKPKPKEDENNTKAVVPEKCITIPVSELTLQEQNESEIDIPQMKPISENIMWFRPDEKFWEKVSKGETDYDQVVFVQVRPTALIERETNVYHFENGTIVKEYYETFWESEDDPSPKEISSERLIEYPDGSYFYF